MRKGFLVKTRVRAYPKNRKRRSVAISRAASLKGWRTRKRLAAAKKSA